MLLHGERRNIMSLKNLTYFAFIGIVGGLVIGIAVGTNISPLIAGLVGGSIIFLIVVLANLFFANDGNVE
jgi:hypothetical protein